MCSYLFLIITFSPDCERFVEILCKCHEDNKIAKFFGACNNEKRALDKCFREEKERMAKKNRDANLTKRVQRRNWNDEPRPAK